MNVIDIFALTILCGWILIVYFYIKIRMIEESYTLQEYIGMMEEKGFHFEEDKE